MPSPNPNEMLKHVPNSLTCANLVCGCVGIISVFTTQTEAAYFVWAACVFDFFDGFTARILKVSSPIGKELDSLADVVSFGVLPSLAMFRWIENESTSEWLRYGAIFIAIFSALRLAKFNIDENQSDSFTGVPTPANALFITGLVFLPSGTHSVIFTETALIIITIVFSLLLVAPVKLFALKFKNYGWIGNEIRYAFLGLSSALLLFFHAGALPLIILSYIGISLLGRVSGIQKV